VRDLKFILQQNYETSRALIIGINQYKNASPLAYAVNDATEVKQILVAELGFEDENIIILTDKDATKSIIMKSFLRFSNDDVKVDDRLFVFFAGHGHTKSGVRGDVGYLVPHDADMDDYSTFIRWDDLTRNADLIRAKHILFVMDACYGGLAVNRDLKPGSSRFLRDMYQRFSRQVITAGKADETVSDSGGPISGHSVFTGHFIEGLRGKAANELGVITGTGLMSYVYTKVSNDLNSEQTPHYGQFDGDGDFIWFVPNGNSQSNDGTVDNDELISIPYVNEVIKNRTTNDKIEYVKELISSDKTQIKLHDFAVEEVRDFLSLTSEDNFTRTGQYSDIELFERLASYETYTKDISAIMACLSHWANGNQFSVLSKVALRMSDRLIESQDGLRIWVNLRWYPLILMTYSAGIAAIESKNYKSLAELFFTKLPSSDYDNKSVSFIERLANAISELIDTFKRLPDHERNYTPISEYLFKLLQPELDNLFFLGKGYESIFDDFEVFLALVVADFGMQNGSGAWGPIGRFGWKQGRFGTNRNSAFDRIKNDAESYKNNWPPLTAGLFGGSYDRFESVVVEYQEKVLSKLHW